MKYFFKVHRVEILKRGVVYLLESRFGVHDVATNYHSRGIVSVGLSNTQTVRGPDILWIVFCKMWDRDFNPDSASYIEYPI